MGKWKYLNWLVVIIILVQMYRYFFLRYEASASLYILATVAWLAMAALGYYIFVYKVYQRHQADKKPIAETQTSKFPPKERPKVVFKKKDQDRKS